MLKYKFKKYISFLTLIFSLFQLIHSQSNFKSGYIIKNSGDTLKGFINNVGYNSLCKVCKFRHENDTTTFLYLPNKILKYKINDGKYFISNKIDGKDVFVEIFFEGAINLYYYQDENYSKYFLSESDRKLIEIPYKEEIISENNKRFLSQSKKHFGVLKYHTKEVPELQSSIEKIDKPNHDNLKKLAIAYHKALLNNENYIVYNKKKDLLKVFAESNIGYLTLINHISFKANSYFQYGILTHFWLPSLSENFYIRTGLRIASIKTIDNGKTLFYKIPLQLEYAKQVRKLKLRSAIGTTLFNPISFHTNNSLNEGGSFSNFLDLSLSGMIGAERNISKKLSLLINLDFDFQYLQNNIKPIFDIIDNSFSMGCIYSF